MKQILILVFIIYQFSITAQTTISGQITDTNKTPIIGANIYLNGTYDGCTTDENGNFLFTTTSTGMQTLIVSFISFETYKKTANVSSLKNLKIVLKDDINTLDTVVINAGTFEAGNNAKITALKPLDVVTTASALGDFVGALQTLPGTTTVAEDGRLFVRGGEAEETQIFIDGNRVFTPFIPTTNNAPTRGRFSPFLFKGITFSTGGYSAEYGQALSGVLLLNTVDIPDQEKTDISFMSVGLGVGNTQKWKNNSFSINTSYINLAPYLNAFPDRNNWNKPYETLNGEMVFRHSFKDQSLLKVYGAYSFNNFKVLQENINFKNGLQFNTDNRNLYINSSYKNSFGNNWSYETGISYTNDANKTTVNSNAINNNTNAAHFKLKLKKYFSCRWKLNFGSEYFLTDFKENFASEKSNYLKTCFYNTTIASFIETDIFFSKNLATKIGLRTENNNFLNEFTLSPRAAIAYKINKTKQLSLAYGQFYQNPKNDFLKFTKTLKSEKASHFIANYQSIKKNTIFKIEAYFKDYTNLIKFNNQQATFNSDFNNNGYGFAKGIDVFWRQNQTLKNTDYWFSYSFLDTQRNHRNFPVKATPSFAAKHNLSIVGKRWLSSLKSQVGLSYTFTSGRNYTNPNTSKFLNNKTKNFNSLSLNWSYLINQQKIVYFSVNNVLGRKNILGYRYKNTADTNGVFNRQAIVPNADSFFFVGFFWTISDDKKSNQLNNL